MAQAQVAALNPAKESDKSVRAAFWVIVAIALVIRVLYLIQVRDCPLFPRLIMDGAVYDAWARSVADGDWIGTEVFYQAPLYPYFLAVLKLLGGDGLWSIRLVQAVLGSLSCGLLFLAGERAFSTRVGWIAGLTLAFYPPAIFFDGIIQKAGLGGVLVTLLLFLAVRASQSPTCSNWISVGAALGLLMLTREETLLLAPVLLVWILWPRTALKQALRNEEYGARHALPRFRVREGVMCATDGSMEERARHRNSRFEALVSGLASPIRARAGFAAAWLAGAALVLIPVAARNAYVGGEFVLTTSQAGSNFYIGNHAGANGTYAPLRPGRSNTPLERVDARELAELGAGRQLSAAEVSSYWFEQSFTWMRAHPGDWARLMARKARLLFNADEIADSEDQAYYAQYSWLLRWLGHVLHFGIVLPFAAVGIWISWRRPGSVRLLLLCFASLCLAVVAFYVFARYRYPVVPIAILFGAAGAEWLVARVCQREVKQLAVPAALLVGVAIFANVRAMNADVQLAMAYSNAGAVLIEAQDYPGAESQLRRSLELDDDPDTWFNLARAELRGGNAQAAQQALQRALAERPRDPAYLLELGRTKLAQGDLPKAIDAVQESIAAWPRTPEAWALLGSIHAQRGDWVAVADVARRGWDANPNDVPTGLSLAWLLATVPDLRARDPQGALAIAQRFDAQAGGNDFRVLDVLAAAYAANDRFEEAANVAHRALALAEARGEAVFGDQIRQRLEVYRRGQRLVR